ncbi:radical SAM/SPASM domain-containing protein [Pseudodesulfovibrio indicus]|uniref:Radical SAM protein with 4Fe4S-binding SPASM domain n=1 Tax=Pseudodesulfovibrio indicus TaxID=1716143 RepID=A0AA94PVR3_9BACT|nr:radical SAM protein [Pseudodesulfovibrio indicus]TDT91751.1 radical SAM protein with 4Fe4S-binding SPASM domain [Pseudodesulfovibrio indicus]
MKVENIIHDKYGDLSAHDAVIIHNKKCALDYPKEHTPLYIHLTVTMKCNAGCKGCINSCITFNSSTIKKNHDSVPERDAAAIIQLINRDNATDVAVCFYGGEPLLAPRSIIKTIEILENSKPSKCHIKYMLYTNGMNIPEAISTHDIFLDNIWLYSISIDGEQKQHDNIRIGTNYKQIVDNLRQLRDKKCSAQKLMWTTLREKQSLRSAFNSFVSLESESLVNHFFWHFVEEDDPFCDLRSFSKDYENDLHYIMRTYIDRMKVCGSILSILHINELILYLLCRKNRGSSACGVELSRNYDIVSGNIQTCADLPMEYSLGRINDDGSISINDQDLSHLVEYKKVLNCYDCGIHAYCGGRCPVQAITSNAVRVNQYCQLLRLHVAVVSEYIDEIRDVMKIKMISVDDIYSESAYFVQFTDVTP